MMPENVNEHWTPERIREAAERQVHRHGQLLATFPRMDPSDAPATAVARAYLAAAEKIQELTAILALRDKTLELYELRIEKAPKE